MFVQINNGHDYKNVCHNKTTNYPCQTHNEKIIAMETTLHINNA